jgi:hypothetical protein
MEAAPILCTDELLSPEELCRLAVELLSEVAQHDPTIADKARERGIELETTQG